MACSDSPGWQAILTEYPIPPGEVEQPYPCGHLVARRVATMHAMGIDSQFVRLEENTDAGWYAFTWQMRGWDGDWIHRRVVVSMTTWTVTAVQDIPLWPYAWRSANGFACSPDTASARALEMFFWREDATVRAVERDGGLYRVWVDSTSLAGQVETHVVVVTGDTANVVAVDSVL